MRSPVMVKTVGVGLLWAAAGCGSSGRGLGTPDPAETIRQIGECAPERSEESIPPVDAMLDTTTLNAALRDLREELPWVTDELKGQVLLSLEFLPDGTNVGRTVIDHDVSPPAADSIQKLVFASRATAPPADEWWGARVRIDLADEIAYTVSPRVYCPPRPRDLEIEAAMSGFLGTGMRTGPNRGTRTVLLNVLVHPVGYVESAKIVRGAGTGSSLEQRLENFIRGFTFDPATVDGTPVYGEIVVPVRVRN